MSTLAATSPSSGSTTASPTPVRPSASASRRIHASRAFHMPGRHRERPPEPHGYAIGAEQRDTRHEAGLLYAERQWRARPRTAAEREASRAVPWSARFSSLGSPNPRTTRSSGNASGAVRSGSSKDGINASIATLGTARKPGQTAGAPARGTTRRAGTRTRPAPSLAEDDRQRALACGAVGRDVPQVVDDEDRRDQCARPGSPRRQNSGSQPAGPAGTRSRRRRPGRRRRTRTPRPGRGSRTATGPPV